MREGLFGNSVGSRHTISRAKPLQTAEWFLIHAKSYFRQEKYTESKKHIDKALAKYPKDEIKIQCLILQSSILRINGDFVAAVKAAKEALDINPNSLSAKYNLLLSKDHNMELKETKSALAEIARGKAENSDDFLAKAFAYKAIGDSENEIRIYEEAIQALGDDIEPELFLAYGVVAENLAKSEDAFREALLIDPKYCMVLENLGHVLEAQNRFAEAEAVYKEVNLITPNTNRILDLIDMLVERDERTQSMELAQVLLKNGVQDAGLYNNVGDILYRSNKLFEDTARYEKSLESYSKALEIEAGSILYHCNKSMALYALGREREAVYEFNEAYGLYRFYKAEGYVVNQNICFSEKQATLLERIHSLNDIEIQEIDKLACSDKLYQTTAVNLNAQIRTTKEKDSKIIKHVLEAINHNMNLDEARESIESQSRDKDNQIEQKNELFAILTDLNHLLQANGLEGDGFIFGKTMEVATFKLVVKNCTHSGDCEICHFLDESLLSGANSDFD